MSLDSGMNRIRHRPLMFSRICGIRRDEKSIDILRLRHIDCETLVFFRRKAEPYHIVHQVSIREFSVPEYVSIYIKGWRFGHQVLYSKFHSRFRGF
jgi:hypothetical protein